MASNNTGLGGVNGSITVLISAIVFGFVLYIVYQWYQYTLFRPDPRLGRWQPTENMRWCTQEVWIQECDRNDRHQQLHGWQVQWDQRWPTVLLCTGHESSVEVLELFFQWSRRLEVNVLTFDYTGYGLSGIS